MTSTLTRIALALSIALGPVASIAFAQEAPTKAAAPAAVNLNAARGPMPGSASSCSGVAAFRLTSLGAAAGAAAAGLAAGAVAAGLAAGAGAVAAGGGVAGLAAGAGAVGAAGAGAAGAGCCSWAKAEVETSAASAETRRVCLMRMSDDPSL